ncbi:hypothetical protein F383_16255 [Gossypium arboreum]|uniref:Uncharacterized protein n=1 Tax=Gossypium arboreum TaxID=29729 RepID=A0A0B0NA59_GOSAR|nr:hypothetical protein F383_16255 [Gossypium arboreum]
MSLVSKSIPKVRLGFLACQIIVKCVYKVDYTIHASIKASKAYLTYELT